MPGFIHPWALYQNSHPCEIVITSGTFLEAHSLILTLDIPKKWQQKKLSCTTAFHGCDVMSYHLNVLFERVLSVVEAYTLLSFWKVTDISDEGQLLIYLELVWVVAMDCLPDEAALQFVFFPFLDGMHNSPFCHLPPAKALWRNFSWEKVTDPRWPNKFHVRVCLCAPGLLKAKDVWAGSCLTFQAWEEFIGQMALRLQYCGTLYDVQMCILSYWILTASL